MSILKVSGLRKVYTPRFGGTQVEALHDVNFCVEEGEYVAIMGESGSGKTTLLNMLAALDRPTGGSVLLDGKNLADVRESEAAAFRRDHLGFVFQEFNLLDTFTIEDNIYLPLVLSGMHYEQMQAKLTPLALELGISGLLKNIPTRCPAARSSALPWHGHSLQIRVCSSPTNRPAHSTATPPTNCCACLRRSTAPGRPS